MKIKEYKVISVTELWDTFNAKLHIDVDELMEEWLINFSYGDATDTLVSKDLFIENIPSNIDESSLESINEVMTCIPNDVLIGMGS